MCERECVCQRERGRVCVRERERVSVSVCDLLQENMDIYSTKEPQVAFHNRIKFCLDLYNTSIKVSVPFQ